MFINWCWKNFLGMTKKENLYGHNYSKVLLPNESCYFYSFIIFMAGSLGSYYLQNIDFFV